MRLCLALTIGFALGPVAVADPDPSCVASDVTIAGEGILASDLDDGGDDWVSFNACAGRAFTVRTLDLGSAADTVVELYDRDCETLLDVDDNGGPGLASRLEWSAPADGTYHLRIRQADGSSGPGRSYDLYLSGQTSACSIWSRNDTASIAYGSLRQLHDGGFILAGSSPAGPTVTRLDGHGNVVWARALALETVDDVTEALDGGLLAVGLTALTAELIAIKLDAAGNVVWQHSYGPVDRPMPRSIVSLSDGFAVGAGSDDITLVIRTDAGGDVLWATTIAVEQLTPLETGPADSVIVTGVRPDILGKPTIVRLDTNGSVELDRTGISQVPDFFSYTFATLRRTPAGDLLGVGSRLGLGDVALMRLSDAGEAIWMRLLGDETVPETGRSIVLLDDGRLVVVAEREGACWIAGTTASGIATWQTLLPGRDCIVARGTVDGSFLVAGSSPLGAWIARLAEDGTIDEACEWDVAAMPTAVVSAATHGPLTATETVSRDATPSAVGVSGTEPQPTAECSGNVTAAPLEVSPAGSREPLLFTDKTTLVWEAAAVSESSTFNVYHGLIPSLPDGLPGGCLHSGLETNTATHETQPSAAFPFFYLVTGVNGAGEGPAGTGSSGAPRPVGGSCPQASAGYPARSTSVNGDQ